LQYHDHTITHSLVPGIKDREMSAELNVIERSRAYRTPVRTAPHQYKKYELAKRPAHGVRGTPFELMINWFRTGFDRSPTDIYIYEVIVEREKRGKDRKRTYQRVAHPLILSTVVYKTIQEYPSVFHDQWRIIFDEFEFLFTPYILNNNRKGFELYCETRTKSEERRETITQYRIRFNQHKMFKWDWKGNVDDNEDAQWTFIYTKLLFSQNARFIPKERKQDHDQSIHERFAHYGNAMYFIPRNPKSAIKRNIQPGVDAWLRFYLS
ncbi:hypothetical protein PENTCL1PPCAC_29789, partial [Pristionchus entomophagus]